jgi:hypothetical protein
MTNDDFIRDLRSDWQSQDHDVARALQRLRRNRWTPHLALALEMSACVLALFTGLWFAWMAAHNEEHGLLFALSAAVVLITAPALGLASLVARHRSLAWDAESPESLLRVGVRRAEASLRAVRIGHWHMAIVALFVAILWIAQMSGLIRAIEFLVFYTTVCVVVCGASWLWMMRRTKQLRGEHAAYLRLLAKLRVDGEDA